MKKIYVLLFTLFFSSSVFSQVNYGDCQTVNSGAATPCFFGFYNVTIATVSFGTLNYSGGIGTCDESGYLDLYSTESGTVTTGQSYTFSVTRVGGGFPGTGTSGYSAYVDWNNDGDFTDADEQILPPITTTSNAAVTQLVGIPVTATAGEHRMRVRSQKDVAPTDACTNFSQCDTKDFKLIVEGGIPPCEISALAVATNASCGNANGSIDLTVTGGTPPLTYSWSNNATTEDLAGLLPNKYLVDVTDAAGCSTGTDANVFDVSGACQVPTGVTATNFTQNSATAVWDAQECAYRFQVRYRANGATDWIVLIGGIGQNSKNITGLTPSTEYDLQVRANCNGETSEFTNWSSTQTFITSFACVPPTGVNASNFYKTRATISWNNVSAAYGYEIRYRKPGNPTWARRQTTAPVISKILIGLTANTLYEYQVRSTCGPEGKPVSAWSALQNFSTNLRMEEVVTAENNFSVYPNPNNGSFTIEMESTMAEEGSIEVLNMLGQVVYTKEVAMAEGKNSFAVNLNGLVAGVYSVVVKTQEQNLVTKISVMK